MPQFLDVWKSPVGTREAHNGDDDGDHALIADENDCLAGNATHAGRPGPSAAKSSLPRRRRALVWLRKDLRVHDNLALAAALQEPEMQILPIYIIHRPVKKRCGPVRFQFLLECLEDLQRSLQGLGSDLFILRGEALAVLDVVFRAWDVTDLYMEDPVVPYAVARDNAVRRLAASIKTAAGGDSPIRVHVVRGRTLYDPKDILRHCGGHVPTDFSGFLKIIEDLPQPPMPLPSPTCLPDPGHSRAELAQWLRAHDHDGRMSWGASGPFTIPLLEDFGLALPERHSFLYGGETVALARLDAYCAEEARVGRFDKPKTNPASTDAPSTTAMSPYIAFGCLSPREFLYRIMFIQLRFPGQQGRVEVTLHGQLMWREFFYCFAVAVPHFDTQRSNPRCVQIQWRLQDLPGTDRPWDDDAKLAMEQFRAWTEARTGFPWIDAVLRQIEVEGWAHHVARHAVACFLTRGDLYISWLRGAYVFQERLIDLDWPINIGNWLWVSSSCFFHEYQSIHSPSLFAQAWDPQGAFIRKYVPALRDMPARYIFEPWKAPLSVQRAAKCLIGKDYPFPIIDHATAVKRCIQWLDEAHRRNGGDGESTGERDGERDGSIKRSVSGCRPAPERRALEAGERVRAATGDVAESNGNSGGDDNDIDDGCVQCPERKRLRSTGA